MVMASSSVLSSSLPNTCTLQVNQRLQVYNNIKIPTCCGVQSSSSSTCRRFPFIGQCSIDGLQPEKQHFRFAATGWELSSPENDHSYDEANTDGPPQASCFTSPDIGGSSGRSGLFRTPICGGVQSATSAHSLPDPALAVRNLMEQARFAHLCTIMSRMHHRRRGYPFGSFVDFAPDSSGHPIFSLSPLAIHTRNLLADPRCTFLVQNPGWSGLANARVTIFGDVYPLSAELQDWAHQHFIAKHHQVASQQWRNFDYFRMEVISDIYFIGGFGTVDWVDVKAYENAQPDTIAKNGSDHILKELNHEFSQPLRNLLSVETAVDDAAFISIDSKGTDVRVRQGVQFDVRRMSFPEGHAVETLKQAQEAMRKLLSKGK